MSLTGTIINRPKNKTGESWWDQPSKTKRRHILWLNGAFVLLLIALWGKGLTQEVDKLHDIVHAQPAAAATLSSSTSPTTVGKDQPHP